MSMTIMENYYTAQCQRKFPKQTILKSHTPRVITSGSSKWMVYDSVHTYGKNKAIWIRGITSIHAIEVFMTTSQKMMIVLYPVFILLIAMTGYFMLKRALKAGGSDL